MALGASAPSDGVPASEAQHDLPWRLESLGILDGGTVLPDGEVRQMIEELSGHDYDMAGRGSIRYVGDRKNIYKISIDDGTVSRSLPADHAEIRARCVGVCNPDTYAAIMENEETGFDAVLNYVNGKHRDAYDYDPEDGFLRHRR